VETIGIDLAAQAAGTAAVVVEWQAPNARVAEFRTSLRNDQIVQLVESHPEARVGIDAPFGWPASFVKTVGEWVRAGHWASETEPDIKPLRYRLTDFHVREKTERWPLSVSTDLISICAFRPRWRARRRGLPSGSAQPLALPSRKYKGPKPIARDLRIQLVASLEGLIPLTIAPVVRNACIASDHCLDALVSALVTRAACVGLTDPPPPDDNGTLFEEGWIELPTADSLRLLATAVP
jgi:hypothetical protein